MKGRDDEMKRALALGLLLASNAAASASDDVQKKIESAFPQVAAPDGMPAPPVKDCGDDERRLISRAEFERRDWPSAWTGDYLAQRNVAFCLSNGCENAVQVNQQAACAWRHAAMRKSAANDTDERNLKADCKDLSGAEVNAAKAANLP